MSMNHRDCVGVIKQAVNEAIEQAHQNYGGELIPFVMFFEELLTTIQPRHLTATEGLNKVKDYLANERHRDYLTTLNMLIHSHLADQYIIYKALIDILTASHTMQGFMSDGLASEKSQDLYEKDYLDRIMPRSEVHKFLSNNAMIVSLFCIVLYGKRVYNITTKTKAGETHAELTLALTRKELIAQSLALAGVPLEKESK